MYKKKKNKKTKNRSTKLFPASLMSCVSLIIKASKTTGYLENSGDGGALCLPYSLKVVEIYS